MVPYQSNPYQYPSKTQQYWQNPNFLGFAIGGLFIVTLVLALGVIVLLLPPFSLLARLDRAYIEVGRAGNTLRDPDGTRLTFLPESVREPFRVKLTAVPRNLFLEGAVDENLLAAASSIPPNLVMKSPFYKIEQRGVAPKFVTITVPIPNEAEPYHTLDLYTWNGQSWGWVPSRVIASDELIEISLDYLPNSVAVMQTHPLNPHVSATFAPGQMIPAEFRNITMEVNPQGYYLEAEGLVAGQVEQLPPEILNSTYTIVPTIRNWNEDGSVRSDLIDNLLIDDTARQRHIATIVGLIQSNAYYGIELDYRGIDPSLREDFTSLLEQLRAALPRERRLAIRVELPHPLSAEAWDTGAYDWPAIGRIADFVRVPALPDPKSYGPGGQMAGMLDWAVGQVNRYKLQLLLTTSSIEQVNGQIHPLSYQAALTSLGAVAVRGDSTQVAPNQPLDFTLTGLENSGTVQFDSNSGLYWLNYPSGQSGPRTIFLENGASIARKLQLVAQYNIRGVAVQNLFEATSDPRNREVVYQFLNLALAPVEGQYAVVWQVKNQDGGVIAELIVDMTTPTYRWTTPASSGNYQVTAAVSPNRSPASAIPLGSAAVVVTP